MQKKKFFVPNSTLNRSMPFDLLCKPIRIETPGWNVLKQCRMKSSRSSFSFWSKTAGFMSGMWPRQNCLELWDFNTCLYTVIEQCRFYTIVRHFIIRHFLTVVLLHNWYHRLGWSRHDEKSSHESVHQSRWVFCSK